MRVESGGDVHYFLVNQFRISEGDDGWRILAYSKRVIGEIVGEGFATKRDAESSLKHELERKGAIFDFPLRTRRWIVRRREDDDVFGSLRLGEIDGKTSWLPSKDGRVLQFASETDAYMYARTNLSRNPIDAFRVSELGAKKKFADLIAHDPSLPVGEGLENIES